MNYTKEQSDYMVRKYSERPTAETVAELVEELGKSKKSIIGKLSRQGVYRRESYKSKTGEEPVTKNQLVSEIADRLNVEVEELLGLEKTPKNVLKRIVDRLE